MDKVDINISLRLKIWRSYTFTYGVEMPNFGFQEYCVCVCVCVDLIYFPDDVHLPVYINTAKLL